jgi:hypothetical protein
MQQKFPDCKITYSLHQTNYAGGPPNYDTGLFSFNTQTGVVTVLRKEVTPNLNGKSFTLTLTGRAAKSSSYHSHTFTVTYVSACAEVTLNPPALQDPKVSVYVWRAAFIFFELPTAVPPECA